MGKIAFVFPERGNVQGMQSLYETSPAARAVYDHCEVQRLSFEGGDLTKTIHSQPCLFAAGLAAALAIEERGVAVKADGAVGFSLGEVTAAAFGGLMTLKDAYDFVFFRADAMDGSLIRNPGAMLEVTGLDAATVDSFKETVNYIYPALYMAPQLTIMSTREGFQLPLIAAVEANGGKAVPLVTEGAFHCPLMDNAAMEVGGFLRKKTFGALRVPLYANLTAKPYDNDEKKTRRLLADQINKPVLWQSTIENMIADGFDTFVVCGADSPELVTRITANVRVFSVYDKNSLDALRI